MMPPAIYRAANLLVDPADCADSRPSGRMSCSKKAGDTEGAAIWRAIMGAIGEL